MLGRLQPSRAYYTGLASLAVAGILVAYVFLHFVPKTHWFDTHDVALFYSESRWAAGDGVLYRDVPSEYPLLANLLFAACRVANDHCMPLPGDVRSYALLWIGFSWLVFLAMGHAIATRIDPDALWVWLTPGAVCFALLRFDVYPAATTLLALFAFREGRHLRGALWIGLTVALKGYALFALPAVLIYILRNRGWRTALGALALCVGPFVLCNLAVWGFAGFDAMLAPFRFHARRVNTGETSYDAFFYLTALLFDGHPVLSGPLPLVAQLVCAFGAAALRPKTFGELVNALLVSLLGFMSFALFYSPQFLLWILPVACFAADRPTRRLAVAFGWVTFLYYPVFVTSNAIGLTLAAAAAREGAIRLVFFRVSIVLITAIRFAMMGRALAVWSGDASSQPIYLPARWRGLVRGVIMER